MLPQSKYYLSNRHSCTLDALELQRHIIPRPPPYAPLRERFLFRLKKWTIVSAAYPHCWMYFRSRNAIVRERCRHLGTPRYKHVIHPLSKLALARQLIMTVLWLTDLILEPVFSSFLAAPISEGLNSIRISNLTLNCILLVDVFFSFFLGYVEGSTHEIILEPKLIARHYLTTYFVFDFVPVVSRIVRYSVLLYSTASVLALFPFYVLRWVRLITVVKYLGNLWTLLRVGDSTAKCITMAIVVVVIVHWFSFLFFYFCRCRMALGLSLEKSWFEKARKVPNRSNFNLYIEFLLVVACHFYGAGKGNVHIENPYEQLILACVLMCGCITQIYAASIILELFGTINISESKFEELVYQANEYMTKKKLSREVKERVRLYYDCRFQKRFFDEVEILGSLSDHLRHEVQLYSCKNLVDKVRVFQNAPQELIGTVVSMLKQEVFLPLDVIIKDPISNDQIFFISYGTVCVSLSSGREIYHLEDGDHFGETQLYLQANTDFSVVVIAVEVTEVYFLDKKAFWYVTSMYPEIAEFMSKSARAKLELYETLQESDDNETVDSRKLLTLLKKGRILDRHTKRF